MDGLENSVENCKKDTRAMIFLRECQRRMKWLEITRALVNEEDIAIPKAEAGQDLSLLAQTLRLEDRRYSTKTGDHIRERDHVLDTLLIVGQDLDRRQGQILIPHRLLHSYNPRGLKHFPLQLSRQP